MKHPGSKSVGWALVQATRLHRARMGEKLVALGLFAGQEQVLQALSAHGSLTMGELATILRVRPPTASKTISRLTALGLVERAARGAGAGAGKAEDARVVRVALTPEGRTRAEGIGELWNEVEDELLAGLDGKDRKRLRKLLRKAARNLAELSGADARSFEPAEDDSGDEESEAAEPPIEIVAGAAEPRGGA
ncbi:MAG: MarR family winged helix-turn-helix transcriptional regulator [Microvirga sp.]|nr:MarR family winged helix-turn-helix transcriptional regulator [Microvirga sp.]